MEAHGLTHTDCALTPGRAQDETGQSVDPQNAGVPLSDGTSPRTVRNSVFLYTSRVVESGVRGDSECTPQTEGRLQSVRVDRRFKERRCLLAISEFCAVLSAACADMCA